MPRSNNQQQQTEQQHYHYPLIHLNVPPQQQQLPSINNSPQNYNKQFPSPYPTTHPYHHYLPRTPACQNYAPIQQQLDNSTVCLHQQQQFLRHPYHHSNPCAAAVQPQFHGPPTRFNNKQVLPYAYLPQPVPMYYNTDLPQVSLPCNPQLLAGPLCPNGGQQYNTLPQVSVPYQASGQYNNTLQVSVPYQGSSQYNQGSSQYNTLQASLPYNILNNYYPQVVPLQYNVSLPYTMRSSDSISTNNNNPIQSHHHHYLHHHDSGIDQVHDLQWSSFLQRSTNNMVPNIHQVIASSTTLPNSPFVDQRNCKPLLAPPPVATSAPYNSKYAAESVELAILAMAEDGVDIGKKRDYMVFTRETYAQMIDCLQHPNDPLPAHITDRRRWRRLMKLLTLHTDQPQRQCITWHHSPLWIVAVEDWNELIWAFHKVTVAKMEMPSDLVPGHLGCYSVAKTARLLGREYQTRRSRCGIFIEYIHQVLLTCPMCGTQPSSIRASPTVHKLLAIEDV